VSGRLVKADPSLVVDTIQTFQIRPPSACG
jgi:hypothetical protein